MRLAYGSGGGSSPGIIVVQGDSIPGGFGITAPTTNAWPYVMGRSLAASGCRFTLYVASWAGETTTNMLSRQATDVIARYSDAGRILGGHRASCVFIEAAATNDLASGVDEPTTVRTNQNTWDTNAKAPGAGIITGQAGVLPRNSLFSGGINASSFATLRANNAAYCAGQVGTRWAFYMNPTVRPELADATDVGYFFDGVHLTASAHAIFGSLMASAVLASVLAT